ncbi:hypothetical protein O7606_21285 [Micromonospora sp. WMMD882]|uniref:hypothetical protein n=1 Tax=Micromonospora sp. WMMD882 TaxID=3015151 RepID=UPI00248B9154|nr:hypothetical protein [Micromonospora sp. WMMD882]WBB78723.1 hypothetical protein O7606_21285 [Micromonospora sp. WMMD882]
MTPPLSCYTTALVDHLGPAAADRLADAVRLWVRFDAPDGALAFSHHDRIDDGSLAWHGVADWATARAELADQLAEEGSVIVVGNAFHLPWSPHHRSQPVTHWFVLRERHDEGWRVSDRFTALMPAGEQRPFEGWLSDAELRAALTPLGRLDPPGTNRDTYALGTPADVDDPDRYRWLRPTGGGPGPAGGDRGRSSDGGGDDARWPGEWSTDPSAVLAALRDRFVVDERALSWHVDDLWAAARHHGHRLARHGDPELAAQWAQAPKALRFAADSARRGRRRVGVVAEAFDRLIELTERERATATASAGRSAGASAAAGHDQDRGTP